MWAPYWAHKVAQAMKNKMKNISFIDEGMKALEASRMEVGEKEQKNQILKNQLQDFSHLQEQLKDCYEELRHAQQHNGQLRARLHHQQEELEQPKTVIGHLSTMVQPSTTSVGLDP
jgi:hypothetical protein